MILGDIKNKNTVGYFIKNKKLYFLTQKIQRRFLNELY